MLLRSLMVAPERVYSRSELVERAYGEGQHITDRTVDSHIRRIRRKFSSQGVDPIETVYGVGYRLHSSGKKQTSG
jgi:DNA-binding response OmpR family regulator